MKLSLLLLALLACCLQIQVALAAHVLGAEEEGLSTSMNGPFLTQYVHDDRETEHSHERHSGAQLEHHSGAQLEHHSGAQLEHHDHSTQHSHEHSTQPSYRRHLMSYECYKTSQCSSQTVNGVKKFKMAGCCKGMCVGMSSDRNNCGSCGRKCAYGTACCSGQCKRIYGNDAGNCGGCGRKCGNNLKCLYGICGY